MCIRCPNTSITSHICRIGLLSCLMAIALVASPLRADIYCWKDADGTPHFTNYDPPPQAEFCMVEHYPTEERPSESVDSTDKSKPDPLRAQLEEANRQLKKALNKVDDLTEKVEQTRQEARNATEAAQRAEAEAKAAGETRSSETVVFGLPYRRPHPPHPAPYYWHLDTNKYPYYNGPDKPHHTNGSDHHSHVSVKVRSGDGSKSGQITTGR